MVEAAAAFVPGQRVRVREEGGPGHVRTPEYVRGRMGRIGRLLGAFPDPESLAYGGGLPRRPLYEVAFRQSELWEDYEGPATDTLQVDVFEHWLQPVEEA